MKEGVLALEVYTLPLTCHHVKRAEREGKYFKTRDVSTNVIVLK